MIAALALMLLAAPVPVAAPLPRYVLDVRHLEVVAEAGDTVVVRLPEGGAGWRRISALPPHLIEAEPGADQPRTRFAYRLRGAGRTELTFARRGSATLRFRIDAR